MADINPHGQQPMVNQKAINRNNRIIKEHTQQMRNELLDVPSKVRLFLDLAVILSSSTCLFFLKRGIEREYSVEESIARVFWYLLGTIAASAIGMLSIFDIIITIFLRIGAYYDARHTMAYGIICENSIFISLSATGFALAGLFSLIRGPRELSEVFRRSNDDPLDLRTRIVLYFLEEFPLILLGLAFATLALLACRALIYALNYRMHMAHFAKRIEANRQDFNAVRLFKAALGRRLYDCDEDALKIVEIINGSAGVGPGTASTIPISGTVGSCSSCPIDRPCMLVEYLESFYGRDNAELILASVKPHRSSLVTAEEIATFCRNTFNETDKISDGLMEQDNILSKLTGVMAVVQTVLVAVVFLICLGHGSWVRQYGLLAVSGLLGAGYVFSSVIVDSFKSLVFVLVVHPYSVGDPVIIDGKILVVTDIGIFRTSFLEDSLHCTIPNLYLAEAKICNLRMSDCQETVFPLRLGAKRFMERQDLLAEHLWALTESQPLVYQRACSFEELQLSNSGEISLNIRAYFKTNCPEVSELKARKDKFVLELNTILVDTELITAH